jgi:hypothetical protein
MHTPRGFSALSALLMFLTSIQLNSQKQTYHWYFGLNAGLDFTSGTPSVLTNGALNTTEGCSTISDSLGNLLFYTDGVSVWNNTHSVMPNGAGLLGDVSTTQSALIVKRPGSIKDYYIFTLPAEGTGDFRYSGVDMTLDNGKGDVTFKNTMLQSNVTEKMSAVYHCNGKDIWVLIHRLSNNVFNAYKVTSAGVSTVAVVSNTGRVHTRVHGQMKLSTDGKMIALVMDSMISSGPPYQGKAFLEFLNFNNQTGAVTHSISIPLNNWQKAYGVEFSPDNSKVYATYYDISGANGGNSELIQYNLAASNVVASGFTVGASSDPNVLRSLQLASDGKIYVSKSNTPFVCQINLPNIAGAACSYTDNAINVDPNAVGSGCMLGLPGFVQSYFNPLFPAVATCTTETVTPTPTTGISGNTGLAQGGFYYDAIAGIVHLRDFSTPSHISFRVLNIVGKVLIEGTLAPSSDAGAEVPVSELEPGIYVFECFSVEFAGRRKFVRE